MPNMTEEEKKERSEFLKDPERNPYLSGAGRIGRMTDEEKSEMGRKGGAAKAANARARKIMESKLKDKDGILREATASVMADDPEVVDKIMANLAQLAQKDGREALQAADFFLKHSGITAPKQTEVKVEETPSIDETTQRLKNLGVTVLNGGKNDSKNNK